MNSQLHIIKVGGNVIDDEKSLSQFLRNFHRIEGLKVLVHGGGKIASDIGQRMGIEPQYHYGRRITDKATIDLVTMVYGGLINKKITAQLNVLGTKALGISGADFGLIRAHKRPPTNNIDWGWVGDIDQVNGAVIHNLLEKKYVPVIAPLTLSTDGDLLNTNADTIANELAISLTPWYAVNLIYCFEKDGVMMDVDNPDSLIHELHKKKYDQLKDNGNIHSGMLPKLENAFAGLEKGINQVIVGNSNQVYELSQTDYNKCTRIKS